MGCEYNKLTYSVSLIASLIILIGSIMWKAPPLIVASAFTALLSGSFLYHSVHDNKYVNKKLVLIQLALLVISAILSVLIPIAPYHGHIFGMISYPFLAFMILVFFNSFHTMGIHREILIGFTILITPGLCSLMGVVVTALMNDELKRKVIDNVSLTLDFFIGFLIAIALAVIIKLYLKHIKRHRFFEIGSFLEASE